MNTVLYRLPGQAGILSKLPTRLAILPFFLCFFLLRCVAFGDGPNVLLIVADDLNNRIGPYMEIERHTPHLDRLAREGVRFSRAYCQYPICGPSRASFMSGLYPETNGVLGNRVESGSYKIANPDLADHPSIACFLRERGYYTARVSKIFHMGVPGGVERGEAGGDIPEAWDYAFNVMGPETLSDGELELLSPDNDHYGANFARMILSDSLAATQTDYLATSQAIAILENRINPVAPGASNKVKEKPEAPFFLAVGLVRPHVPLIAPENCFRPYPVSEVVLPPGEVGEDVPDSALRRQNGKIWGMSELQQKQVISAYMASVRFMDQQVGRILETLDRLDARENTVVIFLSDHGYNLGEHECWSKISLWDESLRVPMIISAPGFRETRGTDCDEVVELIDLYPTVAELCGFSEEQPQNLQGKSLVSCLRGGRGEIVNNGIAYSVSYGGEAGAITDNRWKYARWGEAVGKSNEELYDHHQDPGEFHNLAGEPEYADVLDKMRKRFNGVRSRAHKGGE